MQDAPFTIVVTSCGRFDLLERTLASLFAHIDEAPAETLVIEDSGDGAVRDAVASIAEAVGQDVNVIVNERQLGQMASIDRAYGRVRTPLIFHCEDDWEFLRTGFIGESRKLLELREDVSLVSLRAREELNPRLRELPTEHAGDIAYFLANPALHPEYFSYSFNPGLRRLDDYRRLGPFAALGYEPDVSYAFKKAGFRMGYLAEPAVRHIGEDRHVHDPHAPKRPSGPVERLGRSVSKRMKRLARRLGAS